MDVDISTFRPDNVLDKVERVYDPNKHRLARLADKLSLFILGDRNNEPLAYSSHTVTWAAFGLGGNGIAMQLEARVYNVWGMVGREQQRCAARNLKRHLSRSNTLFKAEFDTSPVVLSCIPCNLCKKPNDTSTLIVGPGDVRQKKQTLSDYQKAVRRLRQLERRRFKRQAVRTQRTENAIGTMSSNGGGAKLSLGKNVPGSDEALALVVNLYSRLITIPKVGGQLPELQELLLKYLEDRGARSNDWIMLPTLSAEASSNKTPRLPLLQKKLQCIVEWWQGRFTATFQELSTEEKKKRNGASENKTETRNKEAGERPTISEWNMQDAYRGLFIARRAEKMSESICKELDDALVHMSI